MNLGKIEYNTGAVLRVSYNVEFIRHAHISIDHVISHTASNHLLSEHTSPFIQLSTYYEVRASAFRRRLAISVRKKKKHHRGGEISGSYLFELRPSIHPSPAHNRQKPQGRRAAARINSNIKSAGWDGHSFRIICLDTGINWVSLRGSSRDRCCLTTWRHCCVSIDSKFSARFKRRCVIYLSLHFSAGGVMSDRLIFLECRYTEMAQIYWNKSFFLLTIIIIILP